MLLLIIVLYSIDYRLKVVSLTTFSFGKKVFTRNQLFYDL